MPRYKVTVVGAGHAGATTAQRLAERDYCDVVLVDIIEGMPQGKALDIEQAGPIYGYDSRVIGAGDYRQAEKSDVVVLTASVAWQPGIHREDLLGGNVNIVTRVTEEVVKGSPHAVLIVLTNPLDAMTQLTHRVSGFPPERVVGMAGVLDSARYCTLIARELGVSEEDVHGLVVGAHGDTMVPLPSHTSVAGIPVLQLLKPERLEEIAQRTRRGGLEIAALLKTASPYYAPSAGVIAMVDAILLDKRRVLPAAALLRGEYGIDGIYLGVPVLLGKGGVERVIEVELTSEERIQLETSASAARQIWADTERIAGV